MKKLSQNPKETEQIAKIFLEKILKKKNKSDSAVVIGLSGDLGAGKTTFTQSVAKHLGIKDKVSSPTFVIIKKYPIKKSKEHKHLIHIDAYRLKNEMELLRLGWQEIINNKEHLVFIEWPENVMKVMPDKTNYIYISHKDKNKRNLELK